MNYHRLFQTYTFVKAQTEKMVKDKGAKRLARLLADVPDMQEALLIATKSMTQKTYSVEPGMDIDLSKDGCSRPDQAGLWSWSASSNTQQRRTNGL